MYDRWKSRRLYLTRLAKISSFRRQGAAYWKEWLVIFKEDWVGGRARVTIDEELVLWQGWTEIKSWRYWGWFFYENLICRRKEFIFDTFIYLSQCRDLRTGVMWEDFGVLVTARTREFWMFWSLFIMYYDRLLIMNHGIVSLMSCNSVKV